MRVKGSLDSYKVTDITLYLFVHFVIP